ncbi:MAG: hypothetical protein R3C10_21090 [Pirellulales bacterium]
MRGSFIRWFLAPTVLLSLVLAGAYSRADDAEEFDSDDAARSVTIYRDEWGCPTSTARPT